MYYSFCLDTLPTVTNLYSVTRNTVWQITDADNILIIINDGQCRITCGYDSFTAKKEDIVFIPSNHSYTREPIDMTLCTMTYIHFKTDSHVCEMSAAELWRNLSDLKNKLDMQILSGVSAAEYPHDMYISSICTAFAENIAPLLKRINMYSSKRPLLCGMQSSIALCGILLALSQKSVETVLGSDKIKDVQKIPEKLRKAISYIAKNFSQQISLDNIADYCAVSKSQLIRYFRQTLGTTPLDYITDYRISRAKELIFNYPQLTLKEISFELGFDNQHYFSRVFKKFTGETPSHYRERVLNYDDSSV